MTPGSLEGTTIGGYRILRKLGEGGMGTVYVVEHILLGRKAAIKVLLPALSSNPEVVQRFFNEARAVTAIADPGIVQVFDFGIHVDRSAYIVMELLDGESLDTRLQRLGRMSARDALRLMQHIAASLGAAHAKGVVHRDLKPENLFIVGDPAVTGGERAKLLDFGIAKLCSNEPGTLKTQTGTLIGTPVYMSPEQCRGAGNIDHRSDIYSLGCVLFCMLAGRPPFDGEGTGELIAAHLLRPAPTLSMVVAGLPTAIEAVVARCLAKSPDDRFQTMRELAQALAAAEHQLHGIAQLASRAAAASSGRPTSWHRTTTTLGVSTGEISIDPGRNLDSAPHSKRSGWIIGVLAASVVIGAAVFAVGAGGRHRSASATAPAAVPPAAAPAPPAAAPASPTAAPTSPAAAPTLPAAAPAPPAPAKAAAIAVAPIDAGAGNAAAPAPLPVPAPAPAIAHAIAADAPRASHVDTGRARPAIRRPVAHSGDNAHATQVGAGSGTVDRGD